MPNKKIAAVLFIALGEALTIYAQVYAARESHIGSIQIASIFLQLFPFVAIGCVFLLAGYFLGIRALKNIWMVSVVSILSILIIEPVIVYTVFLQLPTTGAVIGFVLAIIGIISNFALK